MPGQSSFPYHDGMSSQPPRRPSTLAADKFRAAQRPIGTPAALGRAAPREASAVNGARSLFATGNAPRPATAVSAARPAARTAAPAAAAPAAGTGLGRRAAAGAATPASTAAASVTATAAREQRDNVFVTSIVVAFVFLTVAIAGVKVSGSMKQDKSRAAITTTLTHAYEQQAVFRVLNQRFATWPELARRGMALPAEQRVVASNASRSHWFMSVRDTNTGIVCSRTGELFDDSPFDRKPSCSTGQP
jgi:hypothetical protein